MKKRIVLITTTQPSVNPRIVKEANALVEAGHSVHVIYCFVTDWANKNDKIILSKCDWTYEKVSGEHRRTPAYQFTRLRFGAIRLLNKYFGIFGEAATTRCYRELLSTAVKIRADWYIGHNPGALAVAVNAAKKCGAKAGFDFEDYHRGEWKEQRGRKYKNWVNLEKRYVPQLEYLSGASPMITDFVLKDFPELKIKSVTLLNVFSLKDQPSFNDQQNDVLKLFWFSQHVGADRGLEVLFEALKSLNDPNIELTITGSVTDEMKNYFIGLAGSGASKITFTGVIPSETLPAFAAKFDVGMALELDTPANRNICLTNKIFTYLLAGNAIILSETAMQKKINKEYTIGQSFAINKKEDLVRAILYYQDRKLLASQKKHNYSLSQQQFNWEFESTKLITIINSLTTE